MIAIIQIYVFVKSGNYRYITVLWKNYNEFIPSKITIRKPNRQLCELRDTTIFRQPGVFELLHYLFNVVFLEQKIIAGLIAWQLLAILETRGNYFLLLFCSSRFDSFEVESEILYLS